MSELSELYQEIILDHNRRPRNHRRLADAQEAEGYNPMCGDRVTVFVKEAGGVIQEVAFQGTGCAISTASASLMTERLKGKTVAEFQDLFRRFHDMVTGKSSFEAEDDEDFEALRAFEHVSEFPMRVKCATLAWHTLKSALEQGEKGEQGARSGAPEAAAGGVGGPS